MEQNNKPISGFAILLLCLALLGLAAYFFVNASKDDSTLNAVFGALCMLGFVFFIKGIMIVNPNQARVLVFFGKYVGTVKANGLLWVNPFYKTYPVSLRSQNLEGSPLKVNDKMGNPIEIAAVIVWQVSDTYKAAFEVADYYQYVKIQS
jgi:regulator of protease activity HflC (stomatin/prohibitin superfamily)